MIRNEWLREREKKVREDALKIRITEVERLYFMGQGFLCVCLFWTITFRKKCFIFFFMLVLPRGTLLYGVHLFKCKTSEGKSPAF